MVVLAILGLAIGISYSTANASLDDVRLAQNNSEATEYVQSEIEDLRYLAPNSSTNPAGDIYSPLGSPTAVYCIDDPTSATPIILYSSAAPVSSPNSCTFDSQYKVLIYNCDEITSGLCASSNVASGSDTFVVQGTWADELGVGTDSVTMVYRIHQ